MQCVLLLWDAALPSVAGEPCPALQWARVLCGQCVPPGGGAAPAGVENFWLTGSKILAVLLCPVPHGLGEESSHIAFSALIFWFIKEPFQFLPRQVQKMYLFILSMGKAQCVLNSVLSTGHVMNVGEGWRMAKWALCPWPLICNLSDTLNANDPIYNFSVFCCCKSNGNQVEINLQALNFDFFFSRQPVICDSAPVLSQDAWQQQPSFTSQENTTAALQTPPLPSQGVTKLGRLCISDLRFFKIKLIY